MLQLRDTGRIHRQVSLRRGQGVLKQHSVELIGITRYTLKLADE